MSIDILILIYLLIELIDSSPHMSTNIILSNKVFMLLRSTLFLAFIFFTFSLHSQNSIYSYTFDSDVEGWQTVPLSNSGDWTWSSNGKADQGTYWNDRPAIDETQNGALVYDGDYIISSGQGDSTMDYRTAIRSPELDFSANPRVFIKFNQYFRNFYSSTSLEISNDFGGTWNTIDLNEDINRNVETSPKDYQIIDITDYAAHEPDVLVRFVFDGQYYFWILDDVFFYEDYPVIPTFPPNIGEYLTEHNYPYLVDEMGWPYVPREAIVNFVPGTPQSVKDSLREEVGAIVKDSCVCNSIETWLFLDSLLQGAIGLSSTGLTTGADEHISTSTSSSEIDDIDFNKYVKADLTVGPFVQPDINAILDAHKPVKGKNPLKIAIIDTGVDILHKRLDHVLHLSSEIAFNGYDDDENCYPDNYVGWNFVDDNNNASDDHGHGSHVAGIIADYLPDLNKKQKVQFIPYKTHDSKGLANLFDVTCAMYQSIQDKVSVVNCSWGFYGNESQVLRTAIEQAYKNKITVVAATGNDSLFLGDAQQYPACYKLPNVISVGSYNIDERDEIVVNSPFSNYSAKYVDVLATGVNIYSTVPYNAFDHKTGTSMAAPVVAGLAAEKYLLGYTNPVDIKNAILDDALDHDHLTFEVLEGNVLVEGSGTGTDPGGFDGEIPNYARESWNDSSSTRNDPKLHETDVTIKRLDYQLALEFGADLKNVRTYITNAHGQIFTNRVMKNVSGGTVEFIDINVLPAGLYFLRINEKVYEFAVF